MASKQDNQPNKHALLIGVSTYGEGLQPIPSARLDVEALAEVLRDPQLGNFPSDQVVVLQDPQRTPMERAVELLFANRDPEDLLLLYFSGHGFRDEQRQLLLSCLESRKFGEGSERGKVQQSTTLRAAILRDYMKNSRSRHQLLILDCCFSGAFAEGMAAKDDGALHLEDFGGEGRAVLISSASSETSCAPKAGDGLSVYTRLLVEGIRTGAADQQQRGFVDAEDLHSYVSRRVAEAAPTLTPQFFPTLSGHRIRVCRVRRDPKVLYRQQVEKLAVARGGELSAAGRRILKDWQASLAESEQICDAQAEQIEAEVLAPLREYAKKKADFADTVAALVAEVAPGEGLAAADWAELRQLQDCWKLQQADVEEILRRHHVIPATVPSPPAEIDGQLSEVPAQAQTNAEVEWLMLQQEKRQRLASTKEAVAQMKAERELFARERAERSAQEQGQVEPKARYQMAQSQVQVKAEAERIAIEKTPMQKKQELQPFSVPTAVVVKEARQGMRALLGPKWRIERSPVQVQGYRERLADGVELTMVQIPAGSFLMGSPLHELESRDDEGPRHLVTLGSFFMAHTPITQAQWREVAGWQKLHRDLNPNPSHFKGPNRPVEQVSWKDVIEFCKRLSQRFGRTYTLPSEAQWEYACRAGTTTPFHFGATLTSELANYPGNCTYAQEPKGPYRQETTDVASFPANPWGLHDMHGNVLEWCLDQWHRNYGGAPTDGSAWVNMNVVKNDKRMLRGGSWDLNPGFCRSACRNHHLPDFFYNRVGLRVVCLP